MAAVTQSDWAVKSLNGRTIATCTTTVTTAESDNYTKKTPKEIDTRRPYTLIFSAATTPDAQALPLDLWVGYADDFAITGDSTTVAATSGANYKQLCDDVVLAVAANPFVFRIMPEPYVADVVTVAAVGSGLKSGAPAAPYHAFNLDGGSTLAAVTSTWILIQ